MQKLVKESKKNRVNDKMTLQALFFTVPTSQITSIPIILVADHSDPMIPNLDSLVSHSSSNGLVNNTTIARTCMDPLVIHVWG